MLCFLNFLGTFFVLLKLFLVSFNFVQAICTFRMIVTWNICAITCSSKLLSPHPTWATSKVFKIARAFSKGLRAAWYGARRLLNLEWPSKSFKCYLWPHSLATCPQDKNVREHFFRLAHDFLSVIIRIWASTNMYENLVAT